MVGSVVGISESHAATVLRLNTPCPIAASRSMLRRESVGLAAYEMGTPKTITAEYSVPTLEPDELSAVIPFGVEALV
jgi:hypothetical protein